MIVKYFGNVEFTDPASTHFNGRKSHSMGFDPGTRLHHPLTPPVIQIQSEFNLPMLLLMLCLQKWRVASCCTVRWGENYCRTRQFSPVVFIGQLVANVSVDFCSDFIQNLIATAALTIEFCHIANITLQKITRKGKLILITIKALMLTDGFLEYHYIHASALLHYIYLYGKTGHASYATQLINFMRLISKHLNY